MEVKEWKVERGFPSDVGVCELLNITVKYRVGYVGCHLARSWWTGGGLGDETRGLQRDVISQEHFSREYQHKQQSAAF
ncbi:hypothetical protein M0804_002959 [Polistes exclamans]|nr:hypothetical protein M0804_002959 [Polistes exclamans]